MLPNVLKDETNQNNFFAMPNAQFEVVQILYFSFFTIADR